MEPDEIFRLRISYFSFEPSHASLYAVLIVPIFDENTDYLCADGRMIQNSMFWRHDFQTVLKGGLWDEGIQHIALSSDIRCDGSLCAGIPLGSLIIRPEHSGQEQISTP